MSAEGFSAPAHLTADHDVSAFDSGTPELDNWLKRRALANEALGTSRTYVVTAGGRRLLCSGERRSGSQGHIRQNEAQHAGPNSGDGAGAVGRRFCLQKQGLGSALLKDALLRTIAAAEIAGIRAVLLHAMSDDAKRFYVRAGFHECPVDPMMMMITLAEVEKNLSPPSGL